VNAVRIEWSEAARQDAKRIVSYIADHNPSAAYDMLDEIQSQAGRLAAHPNLGRSGRVDGTRELVIGRTPYIAIYQNRADHSLIVRVLHGAQQWPHPEGDEP
jgi:toxin ParE1/3/4